MNSSRRWVGALALALAALLVGSTGAVAETATAPLQRAATDHGARVVHEELVAPRTVDLTIDSPALGSAQKARLLLPAHWDSQPTRHWPVLYLLQGCCGEYDGWTALSDVADLTKNTDVLVVMPAGGPAGFYSNWWNHGSGGTPAWETFHLTELRQILERDYRAGTTRAVAGLSMGGLGAMAYAARHPGMFRAAASYSGLVHNLMSTDASELVQTLTNAAGLGRTALWGDPVAQRLLWASHNPFDLAAALRGTALFVSAGNGSPGPLDMPGAKYDKYENMLGEESQAVIDRLGQLHIPVTTDMYGDGTHNWAYWARALRRSFPMLMASIGVPVGEHALASLPH